MRRLRLSQSCFALDTIVFSDDVEDNQGMSTDSTPIFDDALSLPPDERADLAYRLLQSLKPPTVLGLEDPELSDEIVRRINAYEAGETSDSDWNAVSRRMRKALDDRKSS